MSKPFLEQTVLERLKSVIDRETNTDAPGIKSQEIAVEGYLMANELEKLINEEI